LALTARESFRTPERIAGTLAFAVLLTGVSLGLYARFKNLGAAALAVDEYFIARSVQNLLHHGWPTFECGGSYTRGLLLQYLAAPLTWLTTGTEYGPRLISAVSSVLGWPAAYLVARRVGGKALSIAIVTLLAISVWEVEMARFGRMYAPFQTIFLWYVVCFLRRTVDHEVHYDRYLILLTILGTLLWEGGVLLAMANFLPALFELRPDTKYRQTLISLMKFVIVFALSYAFIAVDFRTIGGDPALPASYSTMDHDAAVSVWHALVSRPLWLVLYSIPVGITAYAALLQWRARSDLAVGEALGIPAVLVLGLAHRFTAAAGLLFILGLLPLIPALSWRNRRVRACLVAVAASSGFWLLFLTMSVSPPSAEPLWKRALWVIQPLIETPNIVDQLLRPWAAAVPVLSLGLLALLVTGGAKMLMVRKTPLTARRALWLLFSILLLIACASDTPRHETRYVFFLYPVALVLSSAVVFDLVERVVPSRYGAYGAAAVVLVVFALSEDFQPAHLLHIDRPSTIYKTDMGLALQEHLVTRDDTRALANWLAKTTTPDDVVVSAVQGLDLYYPRIKYFYVDRTDKNFESYSCHQGTVDRWSNHALLESAQTLQSVIPVTSKAYFVTYVTRVPEILQTLRADNPLVEWSSGHLAVVALTAAGPPNPART
jgi:hypothetical protein